MSQTPPTQKHIKNIEEYDKFMLYSRGEIIYKLRMLGKDKSLLSAHFQNDSALTAVIDVLPDNNLLVLDYAAEEKTNQKLIKASRVILHTKHKGITTQFSVSNIQKARLKGRTVLACPLPESLLWVQRRGAYRVKTPLSSRVSCEITLADETTIECNVIDISTTGIAITNEKLEIEIGNIFNHCTLHIDDFGSVNLDIEIRNEVEFNEIRRIGCAFLNVSTDTNSLIQRYIHAIDAMQRKTVE